MTRVTVETSGFSDLNAALDGLGTMYRRKKAAREALKTAAQDIHASAQANAPVRVGGSEKRFKVGTETRTRRRGALKSHVSMGTRLSKRQAMLNRAKKMPVEVYVGTRDRIGRLVEFGTRDTPAQPWLRRAWSRFGGRVALETIRRDMWKQISKQAKLHAKAVKRGKA